MQQHVCFLGYVSFVLVMCSLPTLVLLKISFNQSDCFKVFKVLRC